MTIDVKWVILKRLVNIQRSLLDVIKTVIKVGTVIVVEVIVQLKKRNSQSARWDHDNNKWLVGTEEYQWFHEKTKEQSPWMNLDNALIWIKEHDESKETN